MYWARGFRIISWRYCSATRSAPKATSATRENPSLRTIPTSTRKSISAWNSTGKEGARMAATGWPDWRSSSTSFTVETMRLAFWVQTRMQLPHPMQRSATTSAWLLVMRMALAGQVRTQV